MCFVGGAFALSPLAALVCAGARARPSRVGAAFAWGARAGVFAFPLLQLASDRRAHVAATGVAHVRSSGALFVAAAG